MNKKVLTISLISILLTTISTTAVVLATQTDNQKVLTGEKVTLGTNSLTSSINISENKISNNLEDIQLNTLTSDKLLVKLLNGKTINTKEMKIKLYQDTLHSNNQIIQMNNDDVMLEFYNTTGKLKTYLNKQQNLEKCTLNEKSISLKAQEIFNKLDIENKTQYKMTFLEQFDDEVWRAGFAKEYDGLINNGESIRFSFAPQTNEIITLSNNQTPYDNNAVIITEQEALKIAKSIVSNDIKNLETNIQIEIVSPNYHFYKSTLNTNEVYKKVNVMRKAYVCEFSNNKKTQVYVDCSTGEIIGGNEIL